MPPKLTERQEIAEKVIEIIAQQLCRDRSEITPEKAFLADLDADSLEMVELTMEFEDEFGLSIPDEVADKIKTVGMAIDYIAEHSRKAQGRWEGAP